MAIKFDLAKLITRRGIDNAEPAVSVTDLDATGRCIVSNVVSVVGKFDALYKLE